MTLFFLFHMYVLYLNLIVSSFVEWWMVNLLVIIVAPQLNRNCSPATITPLLLQRMMYRRLPDKDKNVSIKSDAVEYLPFEVTDFNIATQQSFSDSDGISFIFSFCSCREICNNWIQVYSRIMYIYIIMISVIDIASVYDKNHHLCQTFLIILYYLAQVRYFLLCDMWHLLLTLGV